MACRRTTFVSVCLVLMGPCASAQTLPPFHGAAERISPKAPPAPPLPNNPSPPPTLLGTVEEEFRVWMPLLHVRDKKRVQGFFDTAHPLVAGSPVQFYYNPSSD